MGEAKKKSENTDKQLTKELKETFPASDPLTVTREPAGKDAPDAEAPERKPARVSGSAEAQPPKKK